METFIGILWTIWELVNVVFWLFIFVVLIASIWHWSEIVWNKWFNRQ
jgi:hypothetical protein